MKKLAVTKILVSDVEPLIEECKGNVAVMARRLGVSRGTIWNRLQESPTLMARLSDAREAKIDDAEDTLFEKAKAGDVACLIFLLKTQGRTRGYSERYEVEHSGKIDVGQLDYSAMTREQLLRIAAGEDPALVLSSR